MVIRQTKEIATLTASEALQLNRSRHVNERRMAWLSLSFMMIISTIVLFKAPPDNMSEYTGYLSAVLISFSAVVGAYMGFTTWGANKFFEGQNNSQTNRVSIDGNSDTPTTTINVAAG